MLTKSCKNKRPVNHRALLAAVLLTILLIVVSVLPHPHVPDSSPEQARGSVSMALAASAAPCALCDWLSAPHLPTAAVAVMALAPTVAFPPPLLPTPADSLGFALPRDSFRRGPPPASGALLIHV